MIPKIFTRAGACLLAGVSACLLSFSAAAQSRESTADIVRRAQSMDYNPNLTEEQRAAAIQQYKSASASRTQLGNTTPIERGRSESELRNVEQDRRENRIPEQKITISEELRRSAVLDLQGNLVHPETGDIIEYADGSPGPGFSASGMLGAEYSAYMVAQHRLRETERYLQDSIRRNSVFGREIFSERNLTFAPSYNLPTPPNYVLGSGDRLFIDLWGDAEASFDVRVSPDGMISLPGAGVIPLVGLTVEQAEQRIRSRLAQSHAGLSSGSVRLKLSLGDVRSIKVNIIGEASVPGTYTLPALATLFNALYEAGGVSDIGSLRNIRLVRGGRQVAELDVYDYLIDGRQEVNVGLQDNDLIIVQTYDNLVKIDGKVKRPRIYELKKTETFRDLLAYAGGFVGDAYKENITVHRKAGRQYTIHTVSEEEFPSFVMADGDEVAVGEVIRQYANRVTIQGAVWRSGDFELTDGLRTLKDLIRAAEGIRGDALMSRTLIVRLSEDFNFETIAVDLGALLQGDLDIFLHPEDLVRIPSINSLREDYTIQIKGEVNAPQMLIFRENMSIEDAIVMAGGLKESASLARIEVARRVKNPESTLSSPRIADLYQFNISADLRISPETAMFKLEPFDQVFIRRSPGYSEQQSVYAEGEFIFGGEYVLSDNDDRLIDLISKAGGLTPEAYPRGAYLKRKLTGDRFQMESNLRELSERGSSAIGDSILNKTYQPGDYYVVAIDLEAALGNPRSEHNLILQEGDRLIIPKLDNTVTIRGAVLYPSTVPYVKGKSLQSYIAEGGGYAERAKKRPFIIYANGQPASKHRGRWPKVEPGCIIVVPQKAPRGNRMSPAEVMSLASSTTSMGAMITTLVNTLK